MISADHVAGNQCERGGQASLARRAQLVLVVAMSVLHWAMVGTHGVMRLGPQRADGQTPREAWSKPQPRREGGASCRRSLRSSLLPLWRSSSWASSEAPSRCWQPVTMRAADCFRWAMPWRAASFSAPGSFTCYLTPARRWRGWARISWRRCWRRSASSGCCSSIVSYSKTTRGAAQGGGTPQPIYPVVLLVVLSMHSIIAGIALGLETEVAASVLVMLGILFHKSSAAFALMVSVHGSGADQRRLWTVLTIFVVMTPVGIGLGTVGLSPLEGRAAILIAGSFTALAAGTFIYVAILDVIDAEMSRIDDRVARFVRSALIGKDDGRTRNRILKFVLVLGGLASMAALGIWT